MASNLRTIRKRRGSALVIVLWLIILMTMVVTVTARMTLMDGRVSQLTVERIRCRWAARAGVETAKALLLADERDTDTLYDLWSQNDPELAEVQLEGCRFTAKVTDESGKLNINTIPDAQIAYLPDMLAEIADSILDWRDKDDEIRPGGAEAGYYLTLPNGYYCRNGALGTIRELLRVKGVSPDLLYGPEEPSQAWSENEGWIYYLTCSSAQASVDAEGNARVNVNRTARNELMNSLSLRREEAQWIVENRPFQTLVSLTVEKTDSSANNAAAGNTASGNTGNTGAGSNNTSNTSNTNSGTNADRNTAGSTNPGSTNTNSTNRNNNNNSNNRSSSNSSSSRNSGSSGSNNRSGSQQTGTPPAWKTVLEKADQIAFDNQPFVKGRVNINTAGRVVLEALLGGRRELAESIIAYREGLDSGFQSLEELNRVQGMTETILKAVIDQLAVRSSVFLIRSTAVSGATGQAYTVETIVNRDEKNGRVLYWREQ